MLTCLLWVAAACFALSFILLAVITLLVLVDIGTGIFKRMRKDSRLGEPHHTCERRFGLKHFYRVYGKGDK